MEKSALNIPAPPQSQGATGILLLPLVRRLGPNPSKRQIHSHHHGDGNPGRWQYRNILGAGWYRGNLQFHHPALIRVGTTIVPPALFFKEIFCPFTSLIIKMPIRPKFWQEKRETRKARIPDNTPGAHAVEPYTNILDQILQAAVNSITSAANENVLVCVHYGPMVSFFSMYDVELVEPNYRGFIPIYINHLTLNTKTWSLGERTFLNLSNLSEIQENQEESTHVWSFRIERCVSSEGRKQ